MLDELREMANFYDRQTVGPFLAPHHAAMGSDRLKRAAGRVLEFISLWPIARRPLSLHPPAAKSRDIRAIIESSPNLGRWLRIIEGTGDWKLDYAEDVTEDEKRRWDEFLMGEWHPIVGK